MSETAIFRVIHAGIVNDIFGSGCLVFASSYEEYNLILDCLIKKWDKQELSESSEEPRFSKYFKRYEAEEIWNHVTAKASIDAGFGDEVQSNNIPESANALVKRWQDFTATDMASFVDDLKGLIDKQRRDVQRTLLGLPSPYILRSEYQNSVKDNANFFDEQPGNRDLAASNLKVEVDPVNFRKVYSHRPGPPKTQLEKNDVIDLNALSDLFAEKDLKLLREKAQRLCQDKGIREGFEQNYFLVRSQSSQTPHRVKAVANSGYVCDSNCLGFKARKLCAHTIAVAARNKNVSPYLKWYRNQEKKDNLTALTTFAVNKNAGAKKSVRKRRNKSPDVMTSSKVKQNTTSKILGEVVASPKYTAEASSNPLRITIRKSKPAKPTVQPTISTPFELIEINSRIKKCAAGCNGNIRDGPDSFTRGEIDEHYCIRHKEHDFVWIESQGKYKKTFENKHYHVYANCIKSRNPHFDPSKVKIQCSLEDVEIKILKERLYYL